MGTAETPIFSLLQVVFAVSLPQPRPHVISIPHGALLLRSRS